MEHVWIGQNDRRVPPQPRPHGGGGVTVIDAEAQVGYAAAIDQTAQGPRLVLSQRLGGIDVQRTGHGVGQKRFEGGKVVAECLAAGRSCRDEHVFAGANGVKGGRLVSVEREQPVPSQNALERLRQGTAELSVARLTSGDHLYVTDPSLILGQILEAGEGLLDHRWRPWRALCAWHLRFAWHSTPGRIESGGKHPCRWLPGAHSATEERLLMKSILVTGGAGFIGSNFVHHMLREHPEYSIVVYDKLTYAGNLDNLKDVASDPRYAFVQGDICDGEHVRQTILAHQIDTIVNFAAETHVDRSLSDAGSFVMTDVYGTYVLLEAARELHLERYHQVSTDEVYGQVLEGASVETDRIETRSPYSASKAGGDLMVLAYYTSFGLPVTITRGSNSIGPYQYPEKVVPLFVTNALDDRPLPIYGDGRQMRDYQFVGDHCEGIDVVLHRGQLGEIYNLGTGTETRNIDMARKLLAILGKPESLLQYITDRPGHDRRYALNVDKVKALGWRPRHDFDGALEETVRWYVDNSWWWRKIRSGDHYQAYYARHYQGREVDAPAG